MTIPLPPRALRLRRPLIVAGLVCAVVAGARATTARMSDALFTCFCATPAEVAQMRARQRALDEALRLAHPPANPDRATTEPRD